MMRFRAREAIGTWCGRAVYTPRPAPRRDLIPVTHRLLATATATATATAAAAAVFQLAACGHDATRRARQAPIPPAPPSIVHGRIAYSTPGGDIWVMNANGSGRRQITRSGRGIDFDPDLSPDGRRIVFRTSRGHYAPDTHGVGLEGIFVVKV